MNGNTDTAPSDSSARIARLAWLCAFVVPLTLAVLLLGVKSAHAAPSPAAFTPLVFEEELALEDEDEEEGEEEFEIGFDAEEEVEIAEEECEIAEEELAEGEIDAAEAATICQEATDAAKSSASTIDECPLRSASAHASTRHDKLKLTIGYTTNSPVTAALRIHNVGNFKRHLGRSGVFRFSKKLGRRPHGRAVVHIKLPPSERAGCPSRRLVLFPR